MVGRSPAHRPVTTDRRNGKRHGVSISNVLSLCEVLASSSALRSGPTLTSMRHMPPTLKAGPRHDPRAVWEVSGLWVYPEGTVRTVGAGRPDRRLVEYRGIAGIVGWTLERRPRRGRLGRLERGVTPLIAGSSWSHCRHTVVRSAAMSTDWGVVAVPSSLWLWV